jgi:Uma2 family endonuclease
MSLFSAHPIRWTSADLELLAADEWKRYEIIDGELFVTRAPHIGHQDAAGHIYARLLLWSEETKLGKPFLTPGLVFTDTDNVIPDVVWVSTARLATIVDQDGHLTSAPELIVEVLSSGSVNERRECFQHGFAEREAKLKLYSLQGVQEYWIVDWRSRQVAVYRREMMQLQAIATLFATDTITSPLLPGLACKIDRFF